MPFFVSTSGDFQKTSKGGKLDGPGAGIVLSQQAGPGRGSSGVGVGGGGGSGATKNSKGGISKQVGGARVGERTGLSKVMPPAATRYKVCLKEGVPTLLEAAEDDGGDSGDGSGGLLKASHLEGSPGMLPPPLVKPGGMQQGCGYPNNLNAKVDGAAATAAAAAAAPRAANGGRGTEEDDDDFIPQMTDAEATAIADDPLFGFGSDMRVSI